MGTPYSAIITLIVTAGVINVLMGIYVLSNRSKQSMVKTFIVFSACCAFYTFGSALELSASSLEEIMFWIKIQYIGMPFIPPINLLLIMHFLSMDRYLKRPLRMGLFLMPAITLALVMTNEAHHLYYRSVEINTEAAIMKANLAAGPWYIIQGAFTFGCMIGGVVLLIRHWSRMKYSYKLQTLTMLVGLMLPLIGDFVYLGGLTPDGLDPIPVIMTVTSALYLWVLTSRGLLNVVPIARDNLFESMRDGVLVLDLDNKLVDYNPAAADIMPELSSYWIGKSIESQWSLHTDNPLPELSVEGRYEAEGAHPSKRQQILWTVREHSRYYEIRSSVVRKKNRQEAGRLITMIDVTDRVQLEERLRELAYHDGLTGAFNRIHFMARSEELLSQSISQGRPLSIVLFDIDYFKRINDAYGHHAGDQALLHVVELTRRVLRPEDVFARYGGEEFVVAMPGLTLSEAEAAAHRIRSEIAGHPMHTQKGPISITASFGAAAAEVSWGESDARSGVNVLLKAADRALYAAKSSGRNTVRLAENDLVLSSKT